MLTALQGQSAQGIQHVIPQTSLRSPLPVYVKEDHEHCCTTGPHTMWLPTVDSTAARYANAHLLFLPFRDPCGAFPKIDLLFSMLALCMHDARRTFIPGDATFYTID